MAEPCALAIEHRSLTSSEAVLSLHSVHIYGSTVPLVRAAVDLKKSLSLLWKVLFLVLRGGYLFPSFRKPDSGTGLVTNDPTIHQVLLGYMIQIAILQWPEIWCSLLHKVSCEINDSIFISQAMGYIVR